MGRLVKETEDEQRELLGIIDKTLEEVGTYQREYPKGWNAFIGDFCCRVVKEFLERHTDEKYKVDGPHVYIEKIPTEFDLLIVEPATTPSKYTNVYPIEKVRGVIEVKKRGVYGGISKLKNRLKRIRENFERPKKENPKIRCAYITIEERLKPKKENSIKYYEETKNELKSYGVFALRDSSRSKEIKHGEWSEFLKYLLKEET